ncbi:MAG: DUF4136 domain-containing protein [Proteobacteria bacterium]|nr:DUF4136 domain-containing protein [Pseudomonadota bacterium]
MKHTLSILVLFALLAACSSKPTYEFDHDHGFDFSRLKTYHWYDDMVKSELGAYRKMNASDKRIREVVGNELFRHGFKESDARAADFWINYTISKQRQQISRSTGYDQGMHGSVGAGTYGKSVSVGYSSGPSVREYEEGTAILDIIDASTQKIVWRGVAEGRLKDHPSMNERYKATVEVTRELLAGFPPRAVAP